jgi:hypothetical protein
MMLCLTDLEAINNKLLNAATLRLLENMTLIQDSHHNTGLRLYPIDA